MGDKWKVENEDLSSMNMEMTQVGDELNEEMDKWCENRSGWVNDRVKECIDQRSENQNYRYTRKICGADDGRTKHIEDIYIYIHEKERKSKA